MLLLLMLVARMLRLRVVRLLLRLLLRLRLRMAPVDRVSDLPRCWGWGLL